MPRDTGDRARRLAPGVGALAEPLHEAGRRDAATGAEALAQLRSDSGAGLPFRVTWLALHTQGRLPDDEDRGAATVGTVTAGNASPYSDGSAALVDMSRTSADVAGTTWSYTLTAGDYAALGQGEETVAAARAWAWLSGRDYVTPDDVKALARPALRHRVELRPEAELEGVTPDAVLDGVLGAVPVPR